MIKLMITLSDIDAKPCYRYNNLPVGEFDAISEIKKRGKKIEDLTWLIMHCKKAQNNEVFDYYLTMNPDLENLALVITNCKKAQTKKFFDFYLKDKPATYYMRRLIINCPKAQTKKFFNAYLKAKPSYCDVKWLIEHCEKAKGHKAVQNRLKRLKQLKAHKELV